MKDRMRQVKALSVYKLPKVKGEDRVGRYEFSITFIDKNTNYITYKKGWAFTKRGAIRQAWKTAEKSCRVKPEPKRVYWYINGKEQDV